MAIRLVGEVPCLLRHFLLANTLHIVPYKSRLLINEYFRNILGLRASLSHVALDTGYNFWKEYILRFFKTPPFKNLKRGNGLGKGWNLTIALRIYHVPVKLVVSYFVQKHAVSKGFCEWLAWPGMPISVPSQIAVDCKSVHYKFVQCISTLEFSLHITRKQRRQTIH